MSRCDITMISGNIKALECQKMKTRLRAEQPEVLRDLLRVIQECRNLSFMFEMLAADDCRKGLARDLRMDKEKQRGLLEQDVRQYMMQFQSDKLPKVYASMWRVRDWIQEQPEDWTLTWTELKRCRDEFECEDGAPTSLDELRLRFNSMGHSIAVLASSAEWREICAELMTDGKRR